MNNQRTNRTRTKKSYYIDGSTVRQFETAPDYREVRREKERREREEQARRRKAAARRNQQKELQMSKSYVLFLTMAVVVFGFFAGSFIKMQSDMTTRLKTISGLESQIADLKAENDEAFKRINMSIDINAIKDHAIQGLGMSYVTSDQIVYYTVSNDDYMNQYSDIPTK